MHNSIVHTENGFRGVPVAVAYPGKRSDQATRVLQCAQACPHSRRLTQNGVGLRWPRFQKPGFRKHCSNIDIHTSLAVAPSFYFQFIVYYSQPSEVDMLCFRSVMLVRSFTANKISGTRHQPLLHAIRNIFVFVLVLPPIEMICKMCCPTSDIHSTDVLE